MGVTLAVENMTIEEKIQTMETIWDDLCHKVNSVSSPSWHANVLNDRENEVAHGEDAFTDWDSAKKSIADSLKTLAKV